MAGANKIDSNITGLRYAEETLNSIGNLPATPVWNPLEPNSYGEFGAQISTTARAPITPGRQRRKGVVTDLDAAVGFQTDFLQDGMYDLMQSFMFADWRKKPDSEPTAVTGTGYTIGADASDFAVGDLVFAQDFATSGNNGLKSVTATSGTSISCSGLTAEASPPSGAKVTRVGVQAGSADVAVDASGSDPALTSTALDFTTLGLIPGEWLFIGGDATAEQFDTAANNGFARIKSVSASRLELDRQPGTMVTDAGTGKTIRLFFGHVIKNENDPSLIKCRSYTMERSLGTAGYEYVKGCVGNTLELRINTADKVMCEMGFVGIDAEGAASAKAGTRPALKDEEAFNSSSDFSRLRMLNDETAATLFTYVTELTLTINNNVNPSKAVGVLGGFDIAAGDFVAAGNVTAYFTSYDAVSAVRNNDSISLDFAMVRENAGWVFDVPLITLGDGRAQVEKDAEIKLPLSMEGAAHPTLNHTLLAQSFVYLPTAAE